MGARPTEVRGFIDRVVVQAIAPDSFLSLRALATLAGVSVKTLRRWLELPGHRALPHHRMPTGTILIKKNDWDLWAEQFRVIGRPGVDAILKGLGLRQGH